MAAANTTDGLLTSTRYTVLQDVEHAFPPYQACFVVRDDVLDKTPGLSNALAALSGAIDDATMRQMNRRVDIDHVPVVRVAADFLSNLDKHRQKASHASL
jgi:osmoprotectant transport system substrate-binding protein